MANKSARLELQDGSITIGCETNGRLMSNGLTAQGR